MSTGLNHLHITKYQAPLTENYVQGTVLGSLVKYSLGMSGKNLYKLQQN